MMKISETPKKNHIRTQGNILFYQCEIQHATGTNGIEQKTALHLTGTALQSCQKCAKVLRNNINVARRAKPAIFFGFVFDIVDSCNENK